MERILHCEAWGDCVAIYTADGRYIVNTFVEYLGQRLSLESFVPIHRSRIVDQDAVEAFERHKRVRPGSLIANSLREHPRAAGLTLGALLVGIPIYFAWR